MIDIRTTHVLDASINHNAVITDALLELTKRIKIESIIDGEQKHIFRLKNINRAIKLISTMCKITKPSDLVACKGIGNGIRRRICEILDTGKLSENTPLEMDGLLDLSKVHGIGPKFLSDLYHKNICSVDDLTEAIGNGTVKVPTQVKIALKYHDDITRKIPRQLIVSIEKYLRDYIPTIFQICGSYRRGALESGDIDVLVMANDHLPSLEPLISSLQDDGFLVAQLSGGTGKMHGICYYGKRYCRIDFLLTSEKEYYPALLHFTGSGLFNQIIRYYANKQGYKLSNLGLSARNADNAHIPCFNSEREIFEFLGIRYLEPSKRDL